MSVWNKWSIRTKLFSIILLILVLNLCLLFFAGSYLFGRFYQSNKTAEIKESARLIQDAYTENSDTFYDEIRNIENRNATVTLFMLNADNTVNITFHSRMNRENMRQEDMRPDMPPPPEESFDKLREFLKNQLLRLENGSNVEISIPLWMKQEGKPEMADQGNPGKNNGRDYTMRNLHMDNSVLSLVDRIDDNLYIYIETPLQYIKSVADLAVQYTCLLSIAILTCGSLFIYFIAGRTTTPIRNIQQVADKIARLDFSERCKADGGDELARLSNSINNMSDKLQASISQLVAANEVLQSDLDRQQKSDRMRRQFVANASHDFKTPLTLIISYAEALLQPPDDETRQEYVSIIISEGNKLSGMVGRLLNLSKLESGAESVELGPFCLREVADDVANKQQILIDKKKIWLSKQIAPDLIVNADYYRIQQVITNLLENAVKYTPEGGQIWLSASTNGDVCTISVENTGAHIDAEDIDNLFDSFYRADKSRTNSKDSFGLGLAIVKAVMEAHQRPYGVENTPGGVRFWFELTLAGLDEDDPDEEEPETAAEETALPDSDE